MIPGIHCQPSRSQVAYGGEKDSRWKFEQTSANSLMGNQFAQAISLVASGHYEEVIKKKKEYPAFKKIFWEEPLHNPPIANAPESYAYDAHYIEQSKYWRKAGKKFRGGLRIPEPRPHTGPLGPDEIPHLFEKPVKMFGRTREVHPLRRAWNYTKPKDRCGINPEKAFLDNRTAMLGPLTYKIPDPWEKITSTKDSVVTGVSAEQSAFKSETSRFPPRRGPHDSFPLEKPGTSIPHSRGRSRGSGFHDNPRPMSKSEEAAKLQAESMASWASFNESVDQGGGGGGGGDTVGREGMLPQSSQSQSLQSYPQQQLSQDGGKTASKSTAEMFMDDNVDLGKLYELGSGSLMTVDAGGNKNDRSDTAKSSNNNREIISPNKNSGTHSHSAGSLPRVQQQQHQQQSMNGSGNFQTYLHQNTNSVVNHSAEGSHRGRGNPSSPVRFQPKIEQSRMKGFTFVTKSEMPSFGPANHNKSFRRVTLPDGTSVILPVSGADSADGGDMQSLVFDAAGGGTISSSGGEGMGGPPVSREDLDLLRRRMGSTGPQLRSLTPPHPSPPSLQRGSKLVMSVNVPAAAGMSSSSPSTRAGLEAAGSKTRLSATANGSVSEGGSIHSISGIVGLEGGGGDGKSNSNNSAANSMSGSRDGELQQTAAADGTKRKGRNLEIDDESSFLSMSEQNSYAASSYGKSRMEKWTPPVYYSSKYKAAAPDIGSVPQNLTRAGRLGKGGKNASYLVRKSPQSSSPSNNDSRNLSRNMTPQTYSDMQYLSQALLNDVNIANSPPRGKSGGGGGPFYVHPASAAAPAPRVTSSSGGSRKRAQDSLGTVPIQPSIDGLVEFASSESKAILNDVSNNIQS